MKILVVDDDPGIVNALNAGLISLDYQVVTAGNGQQALEKTESSIEESDPITLVVTDLIMPGINGVDLLRSVRKFLPALPAILMTAYGANLIREHTKKLEHCSYLEKPFSVEKLLSETQGLTENSKDQNACSLQG